MRATIWSRYAANDTNLPFAFETVATDTALSHAECTLASLRARDMWENHPCYAECCDNLTRPLVEAKARPSWSENDPHYIEL